MTPTPQTQTTPEQTPGNKHRELYWWERQQLERQGCTFAPDACVLVTDHTGLDAISNVAFGGRVELGDRVSIRNVRGELSNVVVGNDVVIADCGTISGDAESACGVGTEVCVLDETGSRPVVIYPGMSAQLAHIAARMPRWAEQTLRPLVEELVEDSYRRGARIADGAEVRGVRHMHNVCVGREVRVENASRLVNGTIVNNAASGRPLAYVGADVDAENFIVEDGRVDGGCFVRNCFVGQGAVLDKHFTAHDSLFFANSSLENGEACAVFSGPYTVSMHKSTLLIGAMTSFMNAGSGTNQSNHMYKLGPVHWGLMERGVKSSSASYVMWGGRIGAFSLFMGIHKNHPDSSDFPFSYLFGDERGSTTVVPGMMLKSCGLLRDEKKWPTRDRRLKRKLPLHDRIRFEVLNPDTVGKMLGAVRLIDELLARPADDDRYVRYKNMKMRNSNLERAKNLYRLAVMKYLSLRPASVENAEAGEEFDATGEWVDLSGQVMPRSVLERVLEAESIEEMESLLDRAFEAYDAMEARWVEARMAEWFVPSQGEIERGAAEFDHMVEEDRQKYLDSLAAENAMLAL